MWFPLSFYSPIFKWYTSFASDHKLTLTPPVLVSSVFHPLPLPSLLLRYADSLNTHLHSLVLRHMPSNLQKLDRTKAGMVGIHTVVKQCVGMECCYCNGSFFFYKSPMYVMVLCR